MARVEILFFGIMYPAPHFFKSWASIIYLVSNCYLPIPQSLHFMSFFHRASNVTINGGQFGHTTYNHSRHETNYDSNNVYQNDIRDSYNNNSRRFGEYSR